jgi:hypothetical protein
MDPPQTAKGGWGGKPGQWTRLVVDPITGIVLAELEERECELNDFYVWDGGWENGCSSIQVRGEATLKPKVYSEMNVCKDVQARELEWYEECYKDGWISKGR